MPFKKKVQTTEIKTHIPVPCHIAIIMDGNGRWAKKRGLPRIAGHVEGSRNLKKIVKYCNSIGVKHLTVYAFSTENWSRPKEEVSAIMDLLLNYLRNAEKELGNDNIRINIIGKQEDLPLNIRSEIKRVIELTSKNTGLLLSIALNYGGRDEILNAVNRIVEDVRNGNLKQENIDERIFSSYLYTAGIPDPDILIRTSGEKRLSNFLLWQNAYSEFFFYDEYWPDFKSKHIIETIHEYQKRERRFGGV